MSIYDLEASVEASRGREKSSFIAASVLTMTIGFVIAAFVVAIGLNVEQIGGMVIFTAILKAVMMIGFMLLVSILMAYSFNSAYVRHINAFALGVMLAFALIFLRF